MNLPRGIRAFETRGKPVCQWIVDGKRKTRAFDTKGDRDKFAASVAGDLKENGVSAFRLNPDEARQWRAFRAQVGEEVPLDDILAVWERYGVKTPGITVSTAVDRFMKAKEGEGLGYATLKHYGGIFARFCETFGKKGVNRIEREEVREWVGQYASTPQTHRTVLNRVRQLFAWLVVNEHLDKSPCDGIKGPRLPNEAIKILTVAETKTLFTQQLAPEVAGRLALEAFAGMRYSTASLLQPKDIDFKARGIRIPAAIIKTRRDEYIDQLPKNLWAWLERAKVDEWKMTPRQYLQAKSKAFTDAGVPHPRNCLRHSAATYHMAEHKDAGLTAAMLCHTNPRITKRSYIGLAKHADGVEYFKIVPKR